ncbi:hypothetical protein BH11PSE11_BH11PSE11_30070 [soil metagenome]
MNITQLMQLTPWIAGALILLVVVLLAKAQKRQQLTAVRHSARGKSRAKPLHRWQEDLYSK